MKDYIYLESENLLVSPRGEIYTMDDLEFFGGLQKQWKDSQQKYTFAQLIEIFPEAIPIARKYEKQKIKDARERLKEIQQIDENYLVNRINKAPLIERVELKEWSDKMTEEARKVETSKIKTAMFHLSHLDEVEGKKEIKKTNGFTDTELEQAKAVPIETFYTDKLRSSGNKLVGVCPFHNEKTGSFMIYKEQNSWYCYSCNAGGSVVDFIMRLENIDFLTAVKKLLK